jgi:hypothetical protein
MSALLDVLRLLRRPEWVRGGRTSDLRPGKVRADARGDVVVFLLGFRINRWLRVRRWLPLVLTVPGMLHELAAAPDSGLLGYRLLVGPGPRQAMIVQYWRHVDDLHRFARTAAGPHRAAQRRYWWHYGASDAVGVWHEVVAPAAGDLHGVYGNMPPTGLGALQPTGPDQWWAVEEVPGRRTA